MNKELINKTTSNILDKFGRENIESLLLIGSVARGEAVPESDVEFLTVLRNDVFQRLDRHDGALDDKISLGFTTRSHLRRLKPYIFTVETKKFGKVLWGDRGILKHIPDYSYEDLDPKDGFILLNNRIVEQLALLLRIEKGKAINQYDFDKGYIQLVNSYLAVNKAYRGLYPEKLAEFLKIYKEGNIDFVRKIKEAFASLNQSQQVITSKEEALARWKELRGYFREMWEYEIASGVARPRNDGVNGWIRLMKEVPRTLIYQAATREYFSEKPDLKKVRSIIKEWELKVK